MNNQENNCLESCDMFDFMSKYVGLNVLHPGGLNSTKDLLGKLGLNSSHRVLDIACGKGINSIMIAKKYGCKVIGIDILEESIDNAIAFAKKNRIENLVDFRVANAQKLPFEDNEFDITIAQAMLILVDDIQSVIQESKRVLKSGGKSGWLELSWKKSITKDFMEIANKELCGFCISNVKTFEEWTNLFESNGFNNIQTYKYTMNYRGMIGMIQDEGLINGLRVMYKYLSKNQIRARMKKLDRFFKNHTDYVGYGIYVGKN